MPVISGGQVMPSDGLSQTFRKAGAVVANDFAGSAIVGSQAVDTTNGKLYICTVTNGTSTATWVVVGAQV